MRRISAPMTFTRFVRTELAKHDPDIYRVLEKVWHPEKDE